VVASSTPAASTAIAERKHTLYQNNPVSPVIIAQNTITAPTATPTLRCQDTKARCERELAHFYLSKKEVTAVAATTPLINRQAWAVTRHINRVSADALVATLGSNLSSS
jgi:hypothetical protein